MLKGLSGPTCGVSTVSPSSGPPGTCGEGNPGAQERPTSSNRRLWGGKEGLLQPHDTSATKLGLKFGFQIPYRGLFMPSHCCRTP